MQNTTSSKIRALGLGVAVAVAAAWLVVAPPGHAAAKTTTKPLDTPVVAEPAPPPPPPMGALDRIRATGRIVLGYRTDAAPMSYRDASGKPAGYSILLCSRIGDALTSELKLPSLAVEWVAVGAGYGELAQHAVDLICAGDEVTLAHRAAASFSIPVFPGGISALVRDDVSEQLQRALEERPAPYQPLWRGSPPPTLEHRTYSAIGASSVETLKGRIAELHLTANVAAVSGYDDGLKAVLERSSDVLFGDRASLLAAVRRSSEAKHLRVLSRRFEFAASALALARDNDDFRLAVDTALTGIYMDPKFGALYTATFGAPDADTVAFFRSTVIPK